MRMPFGKYRGCPLDEVPFEYLEWLVDQDFLREPLASKLRAEYERRVYSQSQNPIVNREVVDELVGAGLRALSKKYHPDVGGDHERMIAVTTRLTG